MKLVVFLIASLLSTSCAIAKDEVELSLKIKDKYRCHLWNNPSKEFSQGYIEPIPLSEAHDLVIGGDGVLYYSAVYPEKLDLSDSHKTIGRMSAACSKYCRKIYLAIDNVLYGINRTTVMWKKELKSPVKGNPTIFNDRLAVLTMDNYLYMLDMENGNTIWSYHMPNHNGSNQPASSYYTSPVVMYNTVFVPFSNGKLVAFDKGGKKLWSYKLPSTNLLDTQLTDITTTPVVKRNVLIATNNSTVVAIDVKSGSLLWSKPIQAKNISDGIMHALSCPPQVEDIGGNEFFVVDTKNEIMKVAIPDGQIIWSTNLVVNDELKDAYYARPVIECGKLFIVSNKGIMLLLDEKSGMIEEIVSIPEGVYHTPVTDLAVGDYYFTTEKKGVYSCIDPNIGR
ncbi:MAG: PQQ-binding-like beta-propeller repeat protein [Wolbachia sp.]